MRHYDILLNYFACVNQQIISKYFNKFFVLNIYGFQSLGIFNKVNGIYVFAHENMSAILDDGI